MNRRQTYSLFHKLAGLWPFLFLFIMMILGSLWDFPISCRLYDQTNPFGLFFAAFGEYPAALGVCAAGSLLLTAARRTHGIRSGLLIMAGIWLVLLGVSLASSLPGRYLPLPDGLPQLIGITASLLTVYIISRLSRSADQKTILRVSTAILMVIALDYLLVNLLKLLWARPRMRLAAADSRVGFIPWWRPDPSLRSMLLPTGIGADEFKSFPSGHTANASALMLLCLLPELRPRLSPRRPLLFTVGFVWTALVALSRIIMGAHYLTDTAAGFAIGLSVLVLSVRLIFPKCPPTSLWTPLPKCDMLKKTN